MNPCEVFEEAYLTWRIGGDDDYVEGDEEVESAEGILQLLLECLRYSRHMKQPLSIVVSDALEGGIENLLAGRPDSVLRKADTQSHTPTIIYCKRWAVGYVKTSRKHKYDDSPVKTICEHYVIDQRTYSRWQKEYADADDDMRKEELELIHIHGQMYQAQ